MVIAPARTGRERSSNTVVIFTDQTKRGTRSNVNPADRILATVEMKLIAPRIEETPARWREKIARSTDGPAWANLLAKGGYTVHPVPTPLSITADIRSKIREGGKSQNLILFIRGNAISGAASIRGISQFPKPPMKIGITMKKIIRNAWAVTITLYSWSLPKNAPG